MPQQFENPANPDAHRRTTALEILEATDGAALDAFVAAVGTGGTLTGVGEVLRQRVPDVRVVAVEPARSPVLVGRPVPPARRSRASAPRSCPASSIATIIDEIMPVRDEDAMATARRLAREEGLLVGDLGGRQRVGGLSGGERHARRIASS